MSGSKKTPEQRLAAAEQRAAQLRHQISATKRRADTRQKIVIGGMVIAAMRDDTDLRGRIVALLTEKVTRPKDREAIAEWLSPT